MNATERLRELLDERGVRWRNNDTAKWRNPPHERSTAFYDENGKEVTVTQALSGRLAMTGRSGLTPEQAVEATLGRGECTLEEVDIDGMSASEYMKCCEWCFDSVYRCSCGCLFGYVAHNRPNCCPNCGARVV